MRLALRLAFVVALLAGLNAAAEDVLFPVYEAYQKAIAEGDAEAAKSWLSKGKRAHLAGKTDAEALSAMNVLSPKFNLRKHKEILDGDDATLVVLIDSEDPEDGSGAVGRIQLAREAGRWLIVSELWEFGGSADEAPSGVREPENDEQRDAIRKLREMGFPIPSAEFLVMSAVDGNIEAVKLFLAAGYSPDSEDGGSPAIVRAATFGHPAIVRLLMDAGADINAVDEANTTALMRLAEKCAATETLRLLIEAGAKTDGKTAGGATALQLAEWSNCVENAKLLSAE